jgi:hypothetical protein
MNHWKPERAFFNFGIRPLVGFCQYHRDRVPLHISLKSRQVAGRVSTHCHVPYGSGPHLPAEVGSGTAMCPMAPDLASR